MISEELVKESTKLERYLLRQGREQLVNELRTLNPTQLKDRLLKQALYRQEIMDAKANDEKLRAAKEHSRELGSVYSENLRANEKIARFVNLLLKDKE